MKIGTKANAIDDLGKFDGSKMTIKVNGKQIYPQKRYAIVRVDKFCPRDLERNYKLKCIGSLHCDKCDLKKKYGDTKEQLLNKIETAIKRKLKGGYSVTYRKFGKGYIKDGVSARELAESIVEFLGVE